MQDMMLLQRTLSSHGVKKGGGNIGRFPPKAHLSARAVEIPVCNGICGRYIVPTDIFPSVHREMPYIFTNMELIRFFTESDRKPYCKTSPCRHLIIPVIYRLIYFCGLRPNEGRELKRSDFCYKDRTLFKKKNKSHQERLIPVAGDLAEMCRNYMNKRMEVYPDTEYMFPSTTGKPYQKRWLVDMRIHSAVYGQHKTQKNAM